MVVRLDPELLFRVAPSATRPDINRQGFREREFPPKGQLKRLLVVGDSFVMGNNVRPTETLPAQLDLPGWEVFNLGVLGYGPDQELLRLQHDGLPLQPDAVLLCLFPGNDFNDLAKNERADVRGWLRWRLPLLVRKLCTGRFLPATQEDDLVALLLRDKPELLWDETPERAHKVALMRETLRKFQQIPHLGVVIIPSWEAIEGPPTRGDRYVNERLAESLCTELGIPYLSLRDGFTGGGLFDPHDHHLSVEGNRRAAELMARKFLILTSQ